jgi:hypothetical protein
MRRIVWRVLRTSLVAVGLAMTATLAAGVMAQDQEQEREGSGNRRRFSWETRVTKTAEVYGVPDLMGTWAVTRREKPVNAAICDKHTDSRGLPRNPCRFNADLLHLTKRAYAWLDFHDERIEGKYYCVPESIPSLLVRDYPVRIEQRVGKVTFEHQITIHNTATRVAYTDGRSPLDAGDIPLYYGYSVGKYEGNELVVETKSFTFDPNGIDYMTNIPSSWRKRVVERYSRTAPDKLRLVLTFEDPEFMKEPYTETLEMSKFNHEIIWAHCDVENAFEDINMIAPKYPD